MAAKKNQVARNARERKRVDQVNSQFDVLRSRLQAKNPAKKLSKADTLRQAALYIRHLEMMLSANPQQPSVSSTTTDYPMCHQRVESTAHPSSMTRVKEEFGAMYLPQDYTMQAPPMALPSSQNGAANAFSTSPTSSVSSSSYSPTQYYHAHHHQMPVNYASYHHHQ